MVDVKGVPSGSRGALREVAQRIERRASTSGGRGFEIPPERPGKEVAMRRDSGEIPRKIKPAITNSQKQLHDTPSWI